MTSLILLILFLVWFLSKFINFDGGGFGRAGESSDDPENFHRSVMWVIAQVMKADGKITKSELAEVKLFLTRHFSEGEGKTMLQYLKSALRNDSVDYSSMDMRPYFLCINQNMEYAERLQLLHTLFKVSAVDSRIEDKEAEMIEMYARFACITQVDFDRLRGYYAYGFTWKNTGRQESSYKKSNEQQRDRGQQENASSAPKTDKANEWAYKELGLEAGASEKEIKKAYREYSKEYHPDKQTGASEEEVKIATEKFQRINEAYEILMEHNPS